MNIAADQGDRVKAGAQLFQLEDSDFRQQVKMAESEVAAATATLDRLGASRRRAEAVLAQARTNHKRVDELISSQAVSQQDLDKAFEALSIAEAKFPTAGAAIIGTTAEAPGRRGTSVGYQRARLRDTTIEVPLMRWSCGRDRDAGDVVTAGLSVLQLASTDQMWITAWVDETGSHHVLPKAKQRGWCFAPSRA